MGCQDQLLPIEARPSAGKTLPMLEKIDRPFELMVPTGARNLPLRVVNRNEGAWLQHRIHEPIFGSNQGKALFLVIHRLKKQQRKLTPALNHAGNISCAPKVETGIEGQGQQHLTRDAALGGTAVKGKQMRLRDVYRRGVRREGVQ